MKSPSAKTRFEQLYEEHADRVYNLAVHFCADPVIAEDIAQSVFLKVYRGLSSFRGDADVTTWIHRITVNACLDHARRQQIRSLLTGLTHGAPEATDPDFDTPLARMERVETTRLVRDAVAALKPRYRLPLLLKYLEDLSYREIAEVLGCRVGTVASRISRGHRLLAKKLKSLAPDLQREAP